MSPSTGEVTTRGGPMVELTKAQFDELVARLEVVEKRLGIEPPVRPETAEAGEAQVASATVPAQATPAPAALLESPGDSMTLIGKSFVGLALAYLLRALTENSLLPHSAGVGLGLLYAIAWLVWAARTNAAETLTINLRALTSALVLVPLLWEATLRFHALSSATTAALLVFFCTFGLAISWRKNLTGVAWVTSLAGLAACAVLLFQSRDLLPYTIALVGIAGAVEISACMEHYLGERWVVALMADLAVLLMLAVATRGGEASTYVPISRWAIFAVQVTLLALYLGSTFFRTLARARNITNFEIAQCVAAFLIASVGALRLAGGDPAAVNAIGTICAIAGLSCYVVSFAFVGRHAGRNRNFHTYATFGLALILAASHLLASGTVLVAVWSGLAVAFAVIGRRGGRLTLQFHATAYLVLAMVASGALAAGMYRYLTAASHSQHAIPPPAVWIAAAAAVTCYLVFALWLPPAKSSALALALIMAVSAIWSVAGILAEITVVVCRTTAGSTPVADLCPTLLTCVLAALCLGVASHAQRHHRRELLWSAVALAVVTAYKLVVQDLSHAPAFSVVFSLLAYGGTLSLLPRFTRWTKSAA